MAKSKKAELEEALEVESDATNIFRSDFIPTGFSALDRELIGRGGIPTKRITEISGKPGACKSMILYQILGNAQKMFPKKKVMLIDTEFVFDPDWAEQQGVDLSKITVIQSNIAEDVYDELIEAASTGNYSMLGLDSLGNLDPRKNFTGARFRDAKGKEKVDQPGVFEKVTTSAVKRLVPAIVKNNVALLVINQDRASFMMYGEPITNPGGNNFRHNLSLRIRLRRLKDIVVDKEVVGMFVEAKVLRSKVGTAGSTDENNALQFVFQGGQEQIKAYQLWNEAVYLNLIVRAGPFYTFADGVKRWKGKEAGIAEIVSNTETLKLVEEAIQNADKPDQAVEELFVGDE